jgi:hypothetical protein
MERWTFLGSCVAVVDAFFEKYEFKLAMEYGQGKARAPVGAKSTVRELAQYCRRAIEC